MKKHFFLPIIYCSVLLAETMPVQIVSFTGYVHGTSVFLNWATATEEHNAGFLIFRSDSTKNGWSDSIQVGEFIAGSGTSNVPHYYMLEDKNVSPGYYRYTLADYTNQGAAEVYFEKVYLLVEEHTSSGGTTIDEFFATVNKNTVTIFWETTAEQNTLEFILERKDSPEENWKTVNTQPGAGTTDYVTIYQFADSSLSAGTYWYRLKYLEADSTAYFYALVISATVASPNNAGEQKIFPNSFWLAQNYPNPFNPVTIIRYSIDNIHNAESAPVILKVYNLLGKEIATLVNAVQEAGEYSVQLNGANLPSGIYFYRLQRGNDIAMKKMLLVK
ncbi:MAG: T9SS type A sorting domain-containing protein [Bacteroidetes bacterium]|nr:T9SS type A sorting domain-containing protein [Bacteroidota bacterium]